MKVRLVSMPWHNFDSPSIAIGSLAAFLRASEPRVSVDCRNEHVHVWAAIRDFYRTLGLLQIPGELVYLQHFYPEMAPSTSREILSWTTRIEENQPDLFKQGKLTEQALQRVLAVTRQHLIKAARSVADGADVVGLTTTFSQLFSSLCLARALKEQNPSVRIVLGGAAASVFGASLLREYSFLDYIVCGEGERRLLHLVRCLLDGKEEILPSTGILSQRHCKQADFSPVFHRNYATWEVMNLDELPEPDYEEYHHNVNKQYHIGILLPMENARGCWWDRRTKTDDAFKACYFCGQTGHATRRDKSIPRIVAQMNQLAIKYQNTCFFFTDSLLRLTERRKLAQAIHASEKTYTFNLELRADIKASTLVDFKEAGCLSVQIGVEGLSTAYLQRMNKGTTTIQNLYAMRVCYELDLISASNLVLGFPGATQAEVEETRFNILNYALTFSPLFPSEFILAPNSTVFMRPDHFGIKDVRMMSPFRKSLPVDVAHRLQLPWLEFNVEGKQADWWPVREAVKVWRDLHQKIWQKPLLPGIPKTLFYFEGGDFIELVDARQEGRTIMLEGLWRELYLFCMEIRSRQEIVARFQDLATEDHLVHELLEPMVTERLMFTENNQYLSLAVANTPAEAYKRIRSEG